MMILHREIDKLKRQLLTLGALVEERVYQAVQAVSTRDAQLAQKVLDGDNDVDVMEVELEEECLKVLALHQPVAIDLRVIVAIMKIDNDLERIGDLAADIAERAYHLATHREVEAPLDFTEMSQNVQQMLQQSLDAFVNADSAQAQQVCAADDAVDDLHRGTFALVGDGIQAQPRDVEQYISYLSVSRFLERIADHATNVAEDVIYLAEGDIVRHKGDVYGKGKNPDRRG